MELKEFDRYIRSVLDMEGTAGIDRSLNGIQVSKKNPEIVRAAFAVDACMEVFERASDWGADLIFVHHGIFWGKPVPLTGRHYKRISFLIEKDIALYAAHLPLDVHAEIGNNAGLAKAVGLQDLQPFGKYKGQMIGIKGAFSSSRTIEEIIVSLGLDTESCLGILPFGKKNIHTAGVIAGGGAMEVEEALEQDLDLYITGDVAHEVYHYCLEGGINMISCGHYNTETFGPRLMMEQVRKDTPLETMFIDIPTGL